MLVEHALMKDLAQSNAPSESIVQKAHSHPSVAQLAPTKIRTAKRHAKFAQQGAIATAKA